MSSVQRSAGACGPAVVVLSLLAGGCGDEAAPRGPEASRRYLQRRADAWMRKSDWEFVHDGSCALSCHSTLPFVLSHPGGDDATMAMLRARVAERVRAWDGLTPHYTWKAEDSRATEAVLNGVVTTWQDAVLAGAGLDELACTALDHMWSAQEADGAWRWMDEQLSPWEDAQARRWSAALVAMSMARAGSALDGCAGSAAHARGLERTWSYLQDGWADTNLHARLMIVWADALGGGKRLLAAQREAALAALRALQRPDGGFSTDDLGSFTPQDPADAAQVYESDGYATGLAVLVLRAAGPADDAVARALEWLERNRQADGSWPGHSLNRPRESRNNGFFTDAATAYASWALRGAGDRAGDSAGAAGN